MLFSCQLIVKVDHCFTNTDFQIGCHECRIQRNNLNELKHINLVISFEFVQLCSTTLSKFCVVMKHILRVLRSSKNCGSSHFDRHSSFQGRRDSRLLILCVESLSCMISVLVLGTKLQLLQILLDEIEYNLTKFHKVI